MSWLPKDKPYTFWDLQVKATLYREREAKDSELTEELIVFQKVKSKENINLRKRETMLGKSEYMSRFWLKTSFSPLKIALTFDSKFLVSISFYI